jgi:hypothetical protein
MHQPCTLYLRTQMFVSSFVLFGDFFGAVSRMLQSTRLLDGQSWLVGSVV